MVNGTLYFATLDNAWAVDARTGQEIWHYFWRTRGGIHIGNRGMGRYGSWLFFETPDNYLVSLDAKTGKERWHKETADVKQEYFSTSAPVVVGNHVILGTGGDSLDVPGFLEARDPGNRRGAVEMMERAAEERRCRCRIVSERTFDAAWRPNDLDSGHIQSGVISLTTSARVIQTR